MIASALAVRKTLECVALICVTLIILPSEVKLSLARWQGSHFAMKYRRIHERHKVNSCPLQASLVTATKD